MAKVKATESRKPGKAKSPWVNETRDKAQKLALDLKAKKSKALEVLSEAIPAYFRAWEAQKRNFQDTLMGAPEETRRGAAKELCGNREKENFNVCKRMVVHLMNHAESEINKDRGF